MRIIVQVFIAFVAFIILMNISLKAFIEINIWLGIGAGLLSCGAFAYTLYKLWKKTGIDGKEKK